MELLSDKQVKVGMAKQYCFWKVSKTEACFREDRNLATCLTMGLRKLLLLLSPELRNSIPAVLQPTLNDWEVVVRSTGPDTDLNLLDVDSLAEVLQGVDTCFIATHTDFAGDRVLEAAQGKAIGHACLKSEVKHVILSGHQSCQRTIGIPALHYDSKAEIYQYYRFELKLPVTMVNIPPLYEIFFNFLRPTLNRNNQLEIAFPSVGPAPIDFIARDDIGACLLPIIEQPQMFMYKTIALCGDKLVGKMVTSVLQRELGGGSLNFIQKQVTVQEVRERRYTGSIDLANMFELLSRGDIKSSPNGTRELYPHLLDFPSWVRLNAQQLAHCFVHEQSSAHDLVTVI